MRPEVQPLSADITRPPFDTLSLDRQLVRVCANVRRVRKELGFSPARTLVEAAAAKGDPIPLSTLTNIETGRRVPSVPMLLRLARAMDVPISELLLELTR